jgi:hypothetical protein
MIQRLIAALIALGTATASAADAAPQIKVDATSWLRQDDGEALLRYFLADGLGLSLRSAQIAFGVDRACELIRPPFEAAVKSLRPKWTSMFRSTAAYFPYEPGNKGRETQLLLAVGLEAVDILQPKLDEISESLKAEEVKVSPDAIDYDARFKEIEVARADGRASCGLRGPAVQGAASAQRAPE